VCVLVLAALLTELILSMIVENINKLGHCPHRILIIENRNSHSKFEIKKKDGGFFYNYLMVMPFPLNDQ
jgi:hypothetical protein